jgi:hypothetical protein
MVRKAKEAKEKLPTTNPKPGKVLKLDNMKHVSEIYDDEFSSCVAG